MATRIIEWFVKATRNDRTVRLPAPEGQAEAEAMAGRLRGFGWHDVEVLDRTIPPEPEPEAKVAKHHGPWPVCDRCDGKHSPYEHETEGCVHCMAVCQKPTPKVHNSFKTDSPEPVDASRPQFRHGMTFAEFTNWVEKAL